MASLNPHAPEFIPIALDVLPYLQPIHDSDGPVLISLHQSPYSIPHSPFYPVYGCCQQSPDWFQSSSLSIYHHNTFVCASPSPLEFEVTMPSYYTVTPAAGNASCAPELLPLPLQAAPVEDKPKGKEKNMRIPPHKKRDVQQKLLWVAKQEGSNKKCPSLRRARAEPLKLEDGKTTVMIKNIPNKYTREMLLSLLDKHCIQENSNALVSEGVKEDSFLSAYDFVYLPVDFSTGCNLGYAFVNFTDPRAALRLHKVLNNMKWDILGSKKVCEITMARIQGKEALENHFKSSVFLCESDEYLPIIFLPHRHGRVQFQFRTVGKRLPAVSLKE